MNVFQICDSEGVGNRVKMMGRLAVSFCSCPYNMCDELNCVFLLSVTVNGSRKFVQSHVNN